MRIKVDIVGDERVLAMLDRTDRGLIDLRIPLKDSGEYLKKYFAGAPYITRGRVFGEQWAALSPEYEKRKAKKWGQKPILIASGFMQKSYKYRVSPGYVRIYNSASYFKYHQSTEPRTIMPRRATMGVNATNEAQVNKYFNDFIQNQVIRKAVAG